MSTTKTRRGRPKGTGIDDRMPLIQIAALIAANPDLKPTTAIRRIGVTEPSVIRRLRDKFKVFHAEQIADFDLANDDTPCLDPACPSNERQLRKHNSPSTQDTRSKRLSADGAKKKSGSRKTVRYTLKPDQKTGMEIRA